MKIQIKTIFGELLFEGDFSNIAEAVTAAIAAKKTLRSANLSYANLSSANLSSANLRYADLSYANLRYADLSSANLSSADLRSADLRYANLSYADLSSANLRYADLRSANLSSANLSSADLRSAKIPSKDLKKLVNVRTIVPEEGDFIAFKKLYGGKIAKLLIPANAERVGGLVGRKCRASHAVVLEGNGVSSHDNTFKYKAGEKVKPKEFCDDPTIECAGGIHFFITRKEAEDYDS